MKINNYNERLVNYIVIGDQKTDTKVLVIKL